MSEYDFSKIEPAWQAYWEKNNSFQTENNLSKPKYYVLDMFPYPSGAGLHVGHPLGYIASDIVARYKRLQGFNVLHPMGFDAFGLPAEQYAIQTGQHPAVTTEVNTKRYKEQLQQLGFSYDWNREVKTSDPNYYKWTQWIFKQLFNSWYNKKTDKAESIENLISLFEKEGNATIEAVREDTVLYFYFSADEWKKFTEKQQQEILLQYRLAYLADTMVNWCPELGTVLANEEVKDGVSERGGYPVIRKKMQQWCLRITAYADRLLKDLEQIDWPAPIKEMQEYWIGKSEGAEITFESTVKIHPDLAPKSIVVYTTRPDTIFGVSYLALAPDSENADTFCTKETDKQVKEYIEKTKNRSERDRMSEVNKLSGVFTGLYALHPFTKKQIPIWIADYVLAGYGTGAVMGVPAHDARDYAFANYAHLPIQQVIEGVDISKEAYEEKKGKMINSDFLNGLEVSEAIKKSIQEIEKQKIGSGKTNYRLRDAIFSRQRYWGEPFPIYYKDGMPYVVENNQLPVELPEIDAYKPTETGEPPLARAKNWKTKEGYPFEASTMPGWAGSSWYFYRYMDSTNNDEFVSKKAESYWQEVDLYIGGSEHATGHLLYARFWTKFLFDLGYVSKQEPFKKLINQGMIQGTSCIIYRLNGSNKFISAVLKDKYETVPIHIDVNLVENNNVDLNKLRQWRNDFRESEFELENGKFICDTAVEKMSKRWYNVVTPDSVCDKYGADTLRLYEMFLGPLEQSKPWNTNGIEGVSKFLRKFWRLFHDERGNWNVSDENPTRDELKILHKTIKKVEEDIENFSFNTSVSSFMICVNELGSLKCNKKVILQDLVVIISPYAPHIAEELWKLLGNKNSIIESSFPKWNQDYLTENEIEYPISVNGKVRLKMTFSVDTPSGDIEKVVLASEQVQKWLESKNPKKVIIVPKKIINIVI